MGEKGMETPAPLRSGVAGAAESMGRVAGVSDMAAVAAPGSLAGGTQLGGLAGLRQSVGNQDAGQSSSAIGQPPKG